MDNSHARGIRLHVYGVAADAGYHVVLQSHNGGRLPRPHSEQVEFPSDRAIPEHLSLDDVNFFPEQAIPSAHEHTRAVFIVPDLPQAGGGYQLGTGHERERMNDLTSAHL